MSSEATKIGFIGLGLMGKPMAKRLLEAGAQLSVSNRTASKCDELVQLGAYAAQSPADLSEQVGNGIIIVCVSDTPALTKTLCGGDGVFATLSSGALIIDMGTSEVSVTRDLAMKAGQLNAGYIDAPVSGGEVGAQTGTLSIMAGGTVADIQRARSVFDVLGKSLTHIGPVGTGQAAKAANQTIVGGTMAIVAESLLLAQSAGADIAKVREALLGGFAGSRILELHGQRIIDGDFAPGGKATTQLKDMKQAADLAAELGLSLPFALKCRDLWDDMVDAGFGGLDQSGYYEFVRTLSGNSTSS